MNQYCSKARSVWSLSGRELSQADCEASKNSKPHVISINKELPGSSPSCRLLRCGYCFSKYCRTTGHCRRFRYEAIRNNGPVSVSVPNCIPVAHGVTFRLWSSLIALHAGLNHSFIAALAPPHRFVAPWNSAACLAIQSLSHTSLQFPNQASQANACHRDKPEWLSGLRVCESVIWTLPIGSGDTEVTSFANLGLGCDDGGCRVLEGLIPSPKSIRPDAFPPPLSLPLFLSFIKQVHNPTSINYQRSISHITPLFFFSCG